MKTGKFFNSMDNVQKTHDYILSHWKQAIVLPKNAESPHMYVKPFLPPCIDGPFKNLYYWDTFFTNKGLLADGLIEEAKNNTENLIHAVNLKGFVPNALSDHMSKFCSQPPYLHCMISDVYNAEHDDEWLEKAYSALKKEYAFWQRERMTATGLNRHYHHPLPKKELIDYYDVVAGERLKLSDRKSDEKKCKLAEGFLAVAESGMDWTPRFGFCGDAILPVDLNANLYALEKHLAEWAEKFEPHESSRFEEAAEKRKRLAEKYFLAADGLYYDYNYVTGERSSLRCSAQFFPFVVGLLRDKAAFLQLADTLSRPYGVLCVEKTEQKTVYQWGYPNSWAPDNFLAYAAAKAVGEEETAERIALCYLETVSAEFEKSGRLWEKYDAVCGGAATVNEYEVPEMLGWTAGVFEYFFKELRSA